MKITDIPEKLMKVLTQYENSLYRSSSAKREVHSNWSLPQETGNALNRWAISASEGPRKTTNQTLN